MAVDDAERKKFEEEIEQCRNELVCFMTNKPEEFVRGILGIANWGWPLSITAKKIGLEASEILGNKIDSIELAKLKLGEDNA